MIAADVPATIQRARTTHDLRPTLVGSAGVNVRPRPRHGAFRNVPNQFDSFHQRFFELANQSLEIAFIRFRCSGKSVPVKSFANIDRTTAVNVFVPIIEIDTWVRRK